MATKTEFKFLGYILIMFIYFLLCDFGNMSLYTEKIKDK